MNIIQSNSIHCLKKNARLCPNESVDCPLLFTYCYFSFVYLFIKNKYLFLVTVCEMSLFRTLQVMNVDVDETVIRNQIHIKGINTPEMKQEGGKKSLS